VKINEWNEMKFKNLFFAAKKSVSYSCTEYGENGEILLKQHFAHKTCL